MIQILLNDNSTSIEAGISLLDALIAWGYQTDNSSIAVAVNLKFVPRVQFAETVLNEGDNIEIVAPMQGG